MKAALATAALAAATAVWALVAAIGFVLAVVFAGVIVHRAPARAWLRAATRLVTARRALASGLALSVPLAIIADVKSWLPGTDDYAIWAGVVVFCLLSVWALTRAEKAEKRAVQAEGQLGWRENGPAVVTGSGDVTGPRASTSERLAELEAWRGEVDALHEAKLPEHEAMAGVYKEACEREDLPLPAAFQKTQPLPPLFLAARDGEILGDAG